MEFGEYVVEAELVGFADVSTADTQYQSQCGKQLEG